MTVVAIIGVLIGIAIICILVRTAMKVWAQNGLPMHPSVPTIVWCAVTVLCLLAIAWVLGAPVPFIRWS